MDTERPNAVILGDWGAIYVGGPYDGATRPGDLRDNYRSVGYVKRGQQNVFVMVCDETTIADLKRHGVDREVFVGPHQAFSLPWWSDES